MSSEQKPNKDYIGIPVIALFGLVSKYLSNISEGNTSKIFEAAGSILLLTALIQIVRKIKK